MGHRQHGRAGVGFGPNSSLSSSAMEPPMKKTFYFAAAAALLMASSAAQAGDGFSFNVDGQKMRIEAPRNCNSLSCLSVTKNGSAIDMKNMDINGRKSDDDGVA